MLEKIKRMFSNLTALFKYPDINIKLAKKRDFYFFCHAWSFGGAERVHIDILNVFKQQNPICFITERSKNKGFRKEFRAAADVINLGRWSEKKAYKAHLHKKIAMAINSQKEPVVFGCNSRFMYELIPLLDQHVKIIDLIHNFSDNKEGAEWYSIPYIPRLHKRITLGIKTVNQFRELYKLNHVPTSYLERITVIPNKIIVNDTLVKKDYNNLLQILFIARNSIEKRVNIFIKIAERCNKINLPVEFKMIGDFESYQNNIPSNTQIVGEIHKKEILNNYYKKADLLLLTSYREGMPLVIFEGMNFGVVPISTNVGELSDYISPEKRNGILIDNIYDENELADLFIKEILTFHNNRTKLKEFSVNAFETIKERFNETDFSIAYKEVILGKSL